MTDKPALVACGFLIARRAPDIELLLMEHRDRLDLPKGHSDPGETYLECAKRELAEETGLNPDKLEIEPDFEFITRYKVASKRTGFQPALKELRIYLAWLPIPDVAITPTEHIGFQWMRWAPGQCVQRKTLDPLLRYLDDYWSRQPPDSRG